MRNVQEFWQVEGAADGWASKREECWQSAFQSPSLLLETWKLGYFKKQVKEALFAGLVKGQGMCPVGELASYPRAILTHLVTTGHAGNSFMPYSEKWN